MVLSQWKINVIVSRKALTTFVYFPDQSARCLLAVISMTLFLYVIPNFKMWHYLLRQKYSGPCGSFIVGNWLKSSWCNINWIFFWSRNIYNVFLVVFFPSLLCPFVWKTKWDMYFSTQSKLVHRIFYSFYLRQRFTPKFWEVIRYIFPTNFQLMSLLFLCAYLLSWLH